MTLATSIKGVPALLGFLALIGGQALCGGSAYAADTPTFGDKPTFQSADNFDYAPSDDKKAFTITFNGLEATVGADKLPDRAAGRIKSEKTAAPISTRVFSTVIPVANGKRFKTSLFASGFVLTGKGTNATLVFDVNGRNITANFPPGTEREFVQRLDYRATGVSEIRLNVFLLAERDSSSTEGAFVGVSTLDTDLALKNKKASGKKPK